MLPLPPIVGSLWVTMFPLMLAAVALLLISTPLLPTPWPVISSAYDPTLWPFRSSVAVPFGLTVMLLPVTPNAVAFPSLTVIPLSIVTPPLVTLKVLAPFKVMVPPDEDEVPKRFSVLIVPEITPFTTSVPPLACKNVCVLPLLAPRTNGTSIVFVPEVLLAPIATAFVLPVSLPMLVPVAVSVSV